MNIDIESLKKHAARSIERVIWRTLKMRKSPNKGSSLFLKTTRNSNSSLSEGE